MNIKSLVGKMKSKKNFLENYVVGGGVPASDNSVMPIMRVTWKESGKESVDTNVGHEKLIKVQKTMELVSTWQQLQY